MERYRSGHNGTASKAGGCIICGSWVRIPLSSPAIIVIINKINKNIFTKVKSNKNYKGVI